MLSPSSHPMTLSPRVASRVICRWTVLISRRTSCISADSASISLIRSRSCTKMATMTIPMTSTIIYPNAILNCNLCSNFIISHFSLDNRIFTETPHESLCNMAEQSGDERVALGRKNDREHFFLEQKCHNAAQYCRNGNLYQESPQYIQMLPKRHSTDFSLIYPLSHIVI